MIIYSLVISLLFSTQRNTMFMFQGLSCHLFIVWFLCLPPFLEMVLATSYICSLFYLGDRSLFRYVHRPLTAYCCPLLNEGLSRCGYLDCWMETFCFVEIHENAWVFLELFDISVPAYLPVWVSPHRYRWNKPAAQKHTDFSWAWILCCAF